MARMSGTVDKLSVNLRKVLDAVEREVDAAPEQRAARRLGPVPVGNGPKVLVLTPRSWSAHVQWEAMVGRALAERGADVRFVTCGGNREICDRVHTWEGPPPPCRSCVKYTSGSLDAHGHRWEPLRESGTDLWPDLDGLGLDELRAVERDGLPLGRLVEVPVGWFLCSTDLDHDPLAPQTYRRFLRSAAGIADDVRRSLDRDRPDVVVMLNGMFLFECVTAAVCEELGIEVVSYERGYVQDTVFFSRGPSASRYDTSELWRQRADRPLTAAQEDELDGYLRARQTGDRSIFDFWPTPDFSEPEPGFCVLFTNVSWDTAAQGRERCFRSPGEWATETIAWFAERPERRLVVRAHPAEVRTHKALSREPVTELIANAFPILPPNVRVIPPEDSTSSYPLMRASDVTLVYTSTAGMEAALAGRPTVTAATTQYGGKGFTIDPVGSADYFETLGRVVTDPTSFVPDVELARRFAWFFFFEASLRTRRWAWENIRGLVRITDDPGIVKPGGDPDLDVICDGILHRRPFVRSHG